MAVVGAPVGQPSSPLPIGHASVGMDGSFARPPAGFWIRAVAVAIDAVVLTIAEAALAFGVWLVFGWALSARPLRAAFRALSFFLSTLYPIIFHWQGGQTVGKMVMHVRVVTLEGGPLSLGQSALRQFASWLSALALGIGYLMAGLRADKRALHDLIAGTRVERLP